MRFTAVAALCLLATAPAQARPYTIDDVLALESYGRAAFDPKGRWTIIERHRRYDQAASYDNFPFNDRALGVVMRVDKAGGLLRPLFEQEANAGYWIGAPSPSGTRLSVFRLKEQHLSIGVVDMGSGTVRWLPLNPATPLLNPVPIWRGDDQLLVLEDVSGDLAYPLAIGSRFQREANEQWARTTSGKLAGVTRISNTPGQMPPPGAERRLHLVDLMKGSDAILASGRFADMALSADGHWVALTVEGAPSRPSTTPVTTSDLAWDLEVDLVRLSDGRRRKICGGHCNMLSNLLSWSPDGARLLFFARQGDQPWAAGSLVLHDADRASSVQALPGGAQISLGDGDWGVRTALAGWIGDRPAALVDRNGERQWQISGTGSLSRLPCPSAPAMRLTDGILSRCGNTLLWSDDKGNDQSLLTAMSLSFAAPGSNSRDIGIRASTDALPDGRWPVPIQKEDAKGHQALWVSPKQKGDAVRLPGRSARLLGGWPETHEVLSIGTNEKGMATLWLSQAGRQAIALDRLNRHLNDVELPETIKIASAVPGKVDWLFLPKRRGKAPLPLIILPYPGETFPADKPAPSDPAAISAIVNPLLLTGQGYAVLQPSLPADRALSEPARGLGALLERAADGAIATGLVDADRMIVYGHSFGGYTALVGAAQSRRFKGFIAASAPTDLASSYGRLSPHDRVSLTDGFHLGAAYGWSETGQGHLASQPWREPERYARNSPVTMIDAIQDPILLIHNDLDHVPVWGAEQMYAALTRAGKPATLIRYWGEGHSFRSPGNMRDLNTAVRTWIDHILEGKAPQRGAGGL
ncbi:alpha/beta hydrolase family protein [Sphingobium boeckii]|uniref:Dienelactone hydrolase n=1 Tax=Sphingobium boeckii TaxID=1082345 RepID=A0A7W9AGE1_9SPHN|nr:prolyl oligopeptidase family serine peptidase [Sphingobium boeckii]MBB5685016.1 dienelactone hydrolase [Sphingobium boeckii]